MANDSVGRSSRWLRWGRILKNAFAAGATFWASDVFYYAVRRSEPSLAVIVTLNVIMPALTLLLYSGFRKQRRPEVERPRVALAMLLGIWLLAPSMIALGNSFVGAGFRAGVSACIMVVVATFIPLYTVMMAAYNFTLPALVIISVLLVYLHRRFECN